MYISPKKNTHETEVLEISQINTIGKNNTVPEESDKKNKKSKFTDIDLNRDRNKNKGKSKKRNKRYIKSKSVSDAHYNRKQRNAKVSVVSEYLFKRKYNILVFFVISLLGIFIGISYTSKMNLEMLAFLQDINENYNINISSSVMLMKILNALIINTMCIFILFLAGITVFSPVIASVVCLVKGIVLGYMTCVILTPPVDKFSIMICALSLFFGILSILVFILSSSESLGFSVFILKSEESYKDSLSFANMSVYSLRQFIFLILVSAFCVLETIVTPLFYAYFF